MNEPSLLYQRDKIRSALQRHREAYPNDNYRYFNGQTAGEVRQRIARLDLETCTAAELDAVMVGSGWGSNECDVCGEDAPVLVRIGDEPDYDNRWQDVCEACLRKAVDMMATATPKP